jgi:hypothetical protein
MSAKLAAKNAAAKFRRAGVHLHELDRRLHSFQKRHPYKAIRQHKPGLSYVQFDFHHAADPPLSIGAVLGDFIQDLRGSLNYLIFELSLLDPKVPQEALDRVEFPIFAEDRPAAIESRISHIPEDAKHIIKAMQPHHKGDGAKAEPLWLLHEMATLDRHCFIPVAGHQYRTGVIGQPGQEVILSGFFQAGEVMMRLPIAHDEELQQPFEGRVAFVATLEPRRWIAIDGLHQMHYMVGNEILPQFNRFFAKKIERGWERVRNASQ